jgi:putative oxidoreductase
MKNIGKNLGQFTSFLLILLWAYAAFSKLLDFNHFQRQMHAQVLFPWLKNIVSIILPPVELFVSALLCFERTRQTGLYCSFVLLFCFTAYVGMAVLKIFPKVPCSCGGILEHMSWNVHFIFNLFFLALTTITILTIKRKEAR